MSLISEFKAFIAKGNVLDLAVAFVMGGAFNTLITAMVNDIVSPIIGIPGHANFATISYTINGSTFLIGSFINALIAFVTVALAIFFFIIKPISKLQSMKKQPEPATPATKPCPFCLSNVPKKATRCPFCTSRLKK